METDDEKPCPAPVENPVKLRVLVTPRNKPTILENIRAVSEKETLTDMKASLVEKLTENDKGKYVLRNDRLCVQEIPSNDQVSTLDNLVSLRENQTNDDQISSDYQISSDHQIFSTVVSPVKLDITALNSLVTLKEDKTKDNQTSSTVVNPVKLRNNIASNNEKNNLPIKNIVTLRKQGPINDIIIVNPVSTSNEEHQNIDAKSAPASPVKSRDDKTLNNDKLSSPSIPVMNGTTTSKRSSLLETLAKLEVIQKAKKLSDCKVAIDVQTKKAKKRKKRYMSFKDVISSFSDQGVDYDELKQRVCKVELPRGEKTEPSGKPRKIKKLFKCRLCKEEFPTNIRFGHHLLSHKADITQETLVKLEVENLSDCEGAMDVETSKCKETEKTKKQNNDESAEDVEFSKGERTEPSGKPLKIVKFFKCKLCKDQFPMKKMLFHHMLSHKEEKFHKYNCPSCKEKFTHKIHFDRHLKSHRHKYNCPSCEEKFIYKFEYKRHLTTHKEYNCPSCEEKFTHRLELGRHMKTHKKKTEKYKCEQCDEIFTAKRNLVRHAKTHNPYKCRYCDEVFTIKHDLVVHQGTHIHACHICGKTSKRSSDIKRHIKVMHEEVKVRVNNHKCNVCSESFYYKRHYLMHVKKHRRKGPDELIEIINEQGEKTLKCGICNKIFTWRRNLLRHIRMHKMDKSNEMFKCVICAQSFTQQRYLNEHMNKHNPEKLFRCQHCGKTFHKRNGFNRHMLTHRTTKGYDYKCEVCAQKFIRKSHKIKHFNTYHKTKKIRKVRNKQSQVEHVDAESVDSLNLPICGDTNNIISPVKTKLPLTCTICDKVFRQRRNLGRHIKLHEITVNPHKCDRCGKTFAHLRYLTSHIQRRHKDIYFLRCEVCDKAFMTNGTLYRHMQKHYDNFEAWAIEFMKYQNTNMINNEAQNSTVVLDEGNVSLNEINDIDINGRLNYQAEEANTSTCTIQYDNDIDESYTDFQVNDDMDDLEVSYVETVPNESGVYKCHICAQTFTQCEQFYTHMKTHIGKNPNKPKEQVDWVRNYKRKMTQDNSVPKCSVCGEEFTNRKDLFKHLTKGHKKDNNTDPVNDPFNKNDEKDRNSENVNEPINEKCDKNKSTDPLNDSISKKSDKNKNTDPLNDSINKKSDKNKNTDPLNDSTNKKGHKEKENNTDSVNDSNNKKDLVENPVKLRIQVTPRNNKPTFVNLRTFSEKEILTNMKAPLINERGHKGSNTEPVNDSNNEKGDKRGNTDLLNDSNKVKGDDDSNTDHPVNDSINKKDDNSNKIQENQNDMTEIEEGNNLPTHEIEPTTNSENNSKKVMTSEKKEKTFCCDICDKAFTRKYNLQKHVETHNMKKYACAVCDKEFEHKSELKDHFIKKHKDDITKKSQIGEKPNDDEEQPNLETKQPDSKPLIVSDIEEEKKANNKKQLGTEDESEMEVNDSDSDPDWNESMEVDDSDSDPDWDQRMIVKEPIASKFQKKKSISSKSPNKDLKCHICGSQFTLNKNLQRHISDHNVVEKTFKCHICNKVYLHQRYLNDHLKTHNKDLFLHCEFCKYTAVKKSDLKRHMVKHTSERPHVCEICSKGFKLQSNLSEHLKTHAGYRPYECDTCGMTFAQKCQLKVHVTAKHTSLSKQERKKMRCQFCIKMFILKGSLVRHLAKKHGKTLEENVV